MRIVVVYKDASDHGREVREYVDDFEKQTGLEIEQKNPDDGRNQFFLRAYDIVEYPTILAIADDGRLLQMWHGQPLPLIDEVAYYAR
ncbi:MAG: hypothetical protein HXL38_000740 [Candidatus Saccharimonas sp.]|jgi:hypothetical protein cdiviTM7_02345|nr:MAG: hypothetical protein HXL38_000740 [Candidatus Saccharimonas sp.]RKW00399.1 MAG: hypothetical protein D8B37_03225 [Candidatus Saccharimonas sp.]